MGGVAEGVRRGYKFKREKKSHSQEREKGKSTTVLRKKG